MVIDKKIELWLDALREENEILRREKEELIAIADKMAQILSDGEGWADKICCVDFYHARDAVYEYAELLKKTKGGE